MEIQLIGNFLLSRSSGKDGRKYGWDLQEGLVTDSSGDYQYAAPSGWDGFENPIIPIPTTKGTSAVFPTVSVTGAIAFGGSGATTFMVLALVYKKG